MTVSCKPLPNELGGKYASQVYAFTNTIGSFAGIFAPMICGILLDFGPIYEFESWYGPGIFAGKFANNWQKNRHNEEQFVLAENFNNFIKGDFTFS